MRSRKIRRQISLSKAPVLRAVRTEYSVRYHVFVNNKINEQLFSFSRQANFNLIMINYERLKYWLRKGLSFHPTNLLYTERILWPKSTTMLATHTYNTTQAQTNSTLKLKSKFRNSARKVKVTTPIRLNKKYKP